MPTSSTSTAPLRTICSGPRLGYRPVNDDAALMTATTPASTRASAATRSTSRWLMTAISPGSSRLTRSLVRRSARARAVTDDVGAGGHQRVPRGRRPVERRVPSSSAAWTSAASESGVPDSMRAISATARLVVQALGHRDSLIVGELLRDRDLMVGHRRHLGEVGDREHLMRATQPGERFTDGSRRGAADAGVHLVEHQRAGCLDQHEAQRQHRARQLAAGRHLGQAAALACRGWRRA